MQIRTRCWCARHEVVVLAADGFHLEIVGLWVDLRNTATCRGQTGDLFADLFQDIGDAAGNS